MKKFLLIIYSKILYFFISFFVFIKTDASMPRRWMLMWVLRRQEEDPREIFYLTIIALFHWILFFIFVITWIYFLVWLFLYFKKEKEIEKIDWIKEKDLKIKKITTKEKWKKYMKRSVIIFIVIFLLNSLLNWLEQFI
jgi:hypothetical protein